MPLVASAWNHEAETMPPLQVYFSQAVRKFISQAKALTVLKPNASTEKSAYTATKWSDEKMSSLSLLYAFTQSSPLQQTQGGSSSFPPALSLCELHGRYDGAMLRFWWSPLQL
ncbi:hypothetical protein KIL84_006466 [Mauremys mutica]|uniref:Uncharacterized protein n=1 Tax=Mauremys mutica TaxID=74926 RepID=A0A9D4AU38_9SAUR|nr:hypothetical protein KIL84_006466 [Mauremys mutica]